MGVCGESSGGQTPVYGKKTISKNDLTPQIYETGIKYPTPLDLFDPLQLYSNYNYTVTFLFEILNISYIPQPEYSCTLQTFLYHKIELLTCSNYLACFSF